MDKNLTAIVFSDLDGTLLDHSNYSWRAAESALSRLRSEGIGLVLATSKTAAEVTPLREELGFADWPSIIENGSGILPPGASTQPVETRYQELRAVISRLPAGYVGFGDMTSGQISKISGLSLDSTVRAKDRSFSEPGIWQGAPAERDDFIAAAKDAGLFVQQGGRFLTLSFGGTKADRVKELTKEFLPVTTIALGDAPNDIDMLAATDRGYIVANSASPEIPPLPDEKTGQIRRTTREGPDGWSEAIFEFLDLSAKTR